MTNQKRKRIEDRVKFRLNRTQSLLLLQLGVGALGLPGCFTLQPAKPALDMRTAPDRVAVLKQKDNLALDFGVRTLNSSTSLTLTIENSGLTAASDLEPDPDQELEAPFSLKGGFFPGVGGTCSSTLAPGASCTIVLAYNPTTDGEATGTFHLNYVNGLAKVPLSFDLSGKTAANLSFQVDSQVTDIYDFSTRALNSTTTLTLTLHNSGITDATDIEQDNTTPIGTPFSLNGGTCGTTLAAGQSCTYLIDFTPTSTLSSTQTLNLNYYNGGEAASALFTLIGKTPAVLSFLDISNYSFGKKAKGTTATATLTLKNTGKSTATLISEDAFNALATPFSFVGGTFPGGGTCTTSLDPDATCTIKVSFELSPPFTVTNTTYSNTLTLQYNDGTSASSANQQTTLPLTGDGQTGWNTNNSSPLAARAFHTGIWTGSKAVFWGGLQAGNTPVSDGALYDPIKDTWSMMASTNTIATGYERSEHTAVWASNLSAPLMIIWGGLNSSNTPVSTGAMYNPATNAWLSTSNNSVPSGRYGHTAVWDSTRKKMILWGGADGTGDTANLLNTGALFDPTPTVANPRGTWTSISTINAPSPRYLHSAIWTGSKMIVWGGCTSKGSATRGCKAETNTGASYDPATDTWSSVSISGAPTARAQAAAVWNNNQMYIWGGADDTSVAGDASTVTALSDGAIYNPTSDSWTSIVTDANTPSARYTQLAFAAGTSLYLWGGLSTAGAGGILDSLNSAWTSMSTTSEPTASFGTAGVYTGSDDLRMIVFGGRDDSSGSSVYSKLLGTYSPE
jgi:N-acetylneuraminic acid mutarotase